MRVRTSLMTSQSMQSLDLNLVAIPLLCSISQKPPSRFSSFFVWLLIWMRRPYPKINNIGSISMKVERFCITMATVQILFRENALGPNMGLSTKFCQDRSKNRNYGAIIFLACSPVEESSLKKIHGITYGWHPF